jgi:hypothetical protein
MSKTSRRIFKTFAVLAVLGVLGIGVLLGSLWLEKRTETTVPSPTGTFAVGRAIYDWKDDATPDALAPVPGTRRELLVWIWYPSETQSAAADDYIPAQMRAAAARVRRPATILGSLFGLLTRDVSKVHGHSVRNAVLSPQQRSYPVVIMRAGASAEVVGTRHWPKIWQSWVHRRRLRCSLSHRAGGLP